MDVNNLTQTRINIDALQKSGSELLPKLQQAGQFRAIVMETIGNRVVLDTAFGQIVGQSNQTLNKGDEIIARLFAGKNLPDIKVEQHFPRILTIKNQTLNKLVQQSGQSLVEARVVSNNSQQTQLQVGKSLYNLPPQSMLKTGDTLLLKALPEQQLQLTRIQPQLILKNALSQLLPRSHSQPQNSGLPSLQQLLKSILNPKVTSATDQSTGNVQKSLSNNQADVFLSSNKQNVDKSSAAISKSGNNVTTVIKDTTQILSDLKPTTSAGSQNKFDSTDNLRNLLQQISQTALPAAQVKPLTVKNMLALLSLLKPLSSELTAQQTTIPKQLELLHQTLLKSPEQFTQLIQKLVSSQAESSKSAVNEKSLLDLSSGFRGELLQQVEQTLSHLLIQKTSVRLQLEQNLPLQININIPLQVNEQSTTLKLKIKQKQRNESLDEQHWEMNLSFEFGLLGLISTHLLLQERRVSAHFWAVQPSTKELIDSHLDDFKQQLIYCGFEPGLFDSHLGQPITPDEPEQIFSDNLVDLNV